MNRIKLYKERLDALGWTPTRLIQEVTKLRRERGENVNVQATVYQALKDPNGRITWINDDIVTALGGRTIVQWDEPER